MSQRIGMKQVNRKLLSFVEKPNKVVLVESLKRLHIWNRHKKYCFLVSYFPELLENAELAMELFNVRLQSFGYTHENATAMLHRGIWGLLLLLVSYMYICVPLAIRTEIGDLMMNELFFIPSLELSEADGETALYEMMEKGGFKIQDDMIMFTEDQTRLLRTFEMESKFQEYRNMFSKESGIQSLINMTTYFIEKVTTVPDYVYEGERYPLGSESHGYDGAFISADDFLMLLHGASM